jgi:D-mannonate dehydratase
MKNYASTSPQSRVRVEDDSEKVNQDDALAISQDRLVEMFQRYLEQMDPAELEQQFQFFMNGVRPVDELVRRELGMHIQYGIHR